MGTPTDAAAHEGHRILVVDDNRAVREPLVALLATSATESSILVDYGWVMLVICIVNASQNMSWRSALPRTARQLR